MSEERRPRSPFGQPAGGAPGERCPRCPAPSAVLTGTARVSCYRDVTHLAELPLGMVLLLHHASRGTRARAIPTPAKRRRGYPVPPALGALWHRSRPPCPRLKPRRRDGVVSLLSLLKQMLERLPPRQGESPARGGGCRESCWGLAGLSGEIVFPLSNVNLSKGKYFIEIVCCGFFFFSPFIFIFFLNIT